MGWGPPFMGGRPFGPFSLLNKAPTFSRFLIALKKYTSILYFERNIFL
jgi:hypothetical protein